MVPVTEEVCGSARASIRSSKSDQDGRVAVLCRGTSAADRASIQLGSAASLKRARKREGANPHVSIPASCVIRHGDAMLPSCATRQPAFQRAVAISGAITSGRPGVRSMPAQSQRQAQPLPSHHTQLPPALASSLRLSCGEASRCAAQ